MSSKKSGKASKAEQDQTTLKIPNLYKKKCQFNGVTPNKSLKQKVDEALQSGKLQCIQTWGEIGPICCRAFMQCLSDLNYQHLKKLRIWKANLQDQGVRAICNYIQKSNTIQYLDLMENNITALGCQFLAKVMSNPCNKIVKLRLDNNRIGDKGLQELVIGLKQNDNIEKLSLNYCHITKNGCQFIQQILANIHTKLRTLKLQGNPLQNQGFYEIIRAVSSCGDSLEKLNLADTGLNLLNYGYDDGKNQQINFMDSIQNKIVDQLKIVLSENKNIAKYNFRNNYISNRVASEMLEKVKDNKNIFIIDLPECIDYELKELHVEIMKKRKLKKKKVGKKGKGKTAKK